jgi:hypothetical protein
MSDDPTSMKAILSGIGKLAEDESKVSVEDVVETFGSRSYGPFLLIPALIEVSPLGAVPGVPTVLACIIILFALQILIGRKQIWLPDFIEHREISSGRVKKAVSSLMPLARWADRWFHGRLRSLTKGVFIRVAAAACIALACLVPMLELVPFASSAPMAAIAMFGLALMVRDGALLLFACAIAVFAAGLSYSFWGWIS